MPKARREIAPAPVDSTGKHTRSPAAAESLRLAVEYDRARRALWRACGCVGLDDDPDLLAAARTADEGFRLSSRVPGVERELAAAKRARDAVVAANLGLARRFVRRRSYAAGHGARPLTLQAEREDAQQAAIADLMVGIDRFDPARGLAPSTYLLHYVARGTRGEELSRPAARIPSRALTDWRKAEAARVRHYNTTGEVLTWVQVCELIGAPASHASVLEGVERALRPPVRAEKHDPDDDQLAGVARRLGRWQTNGSPKTGLTFEGVDGQTPEDLLVADEERRAVRAVMNGATEAERLALAQLAGEVTGGADALARAAGVKRAAGPVIRRRAVERARAALAASK